MNETLQGTEVVGAEFNVGISLLSFTYFLKLQYDPAYFTLTWTLDYQYNSDLGKFVAERPVECLCISQVC